MGAKDSQSSSCPELFQLLHIPQLYVHFKSCEISWNNIDTETVFVKLYPYHLYLSTSDPLLADYFLYHMCKS
jgi:hypothetical protein